MADTKPGVDDLGRACLACFEEFDKHRMNFKDSETPIPGVLIGGFAIWLHGGRRDTEDVDLALAGDAGRNFEQQHLEPLAQLNGELFGYREDTQRGKSGGVFFKSGARSVGVDILPIGGAQSGIGSVLAGGEEAYVHEGLLTPVMFDLPGGKVPVADLRDLLGMKAKAFLTQYNKLPSSGKVDQKKKPTVSMVSRLGGSTIPKFNLGDAEITESKTVTQDDVKKAKEDSAAKAKAENDAQLAAVRKEFKDFRWLVTATLAKHGCVAEGERGTWGKAYELARDPITKIQGLILAKTLSPDVPRLLPDMSDQDEKGELEQMVLEFKKMFSVS